MAPPPKSRSRYAGGFTKGGKTAKKKKSKEAGARGGKTVGEMEKKKRGQTQNVVTLIYGLLLFFFSLLLFTETRVCARESEE